MSSTHSEKLHTRIGASTALCGATERIVGNAEFAATPAADRCRRCARLYTAHGYRLPHIVPHRTHNHRATAIWHRLPAEDKEAA